MGKIEELIKQLCPEGVKYYKVKDVYSRLKGTPITARVMKEIEKPEGNVTIFAGGKTIVKAFKKDIPKANIITEPVLVVQSRGVIDVQYCETPCTFKNEMWAYSNKEIVSVKYLFYYLKQNIDILRRKGSEHGSMPQISVLTTDNLNIPFPPLAVQKEIVEILDTFTGMIDNLQKELEQRQKQFEYYQEKILNFDDVIQQEGEGFIKKRGILGEIDELIKQFCPDGVRKTLLGKIMTIVRGASPRPIKNYMSDKTNGIPWIKIGDVNPNDKYIRNTAEYVTKEGARKSRFLHKGDFILSNSMSFGRPYILGIDGCIHDGWIAMSGFEKDVCSKYLYYILRCDTTQKYWRMHANNGGAMTNLNADIVRGTPIPLPPLAVQEKIVEILDTFTGMIGNLQQEIDLRQKQYEFYREKLLTFE